MSSTDIVSRLLAAGPFARLAAESSQPNLRLLAPVGAQPAVVAALQRMTSQPGFTLVTTSSSREAEDWRAALATLSPEAEILEFPAWETLPHERLSPSPEIVGARLRVLHRLRLPADRPVIVLASVRAVLQPVIRGIEQYPPLELQAGSDYLLPELALKLVELGYARVDLVSRRGELAVRGGILDIFPTTAEHAVRLEFFGDTLEEIREFAVADQRSLKSGPLESIELYAARELIISPMVAARARELKLEFPNLGDMLEKISNGIPVTGMEALAPLLVDGMGPFHEYLPAGSAVVLLNPEKARARLESLIATNDEFLHAAWDAAIEGAQAPIDLSAASFMDLDAWRAELAEHRYLELSALPDPAGDQLELGLYEIPHFPPGQQEVFDWLLDQNRIGQGIEIVCGGSGTAERVGEQLAAAGIAANVRQGGLAQGFSCPEAALIVLTEREFLGRSSDYQNPQQRKLAAKRGQAVDPLNLKRGDYVVHQIHGIGRFLELVQRSHGMGARKQSREYLLIEYAPAKRGLPADTLFVPMEQLDMLSRYVGGEAPVLSKMGGTDWARTTGMARKAVRKIAIDLVKLYSARMRSRGHAFGPDTPWQHELEEAFAFNETPDQLTTIDEVKRDMEREAPMDRLLAGDVGYGKTEVAVRAAFKAIQDGKQVAMLVPTTLLVRQHTDTFESRFAAFPVKVRSLSRFQTEKEVRETLAELATGGVDMVIGTHRLLSPNVKFRNLGLVIIDEEQRFGVEHKERLKELRQNVDVLAMSATPIPRTLEMAITGIREMSTLDTPPEERHPILTYVGGYSPTQVAAAIKRELIREGQVFFVHNRVSSIEKCASDIAELVPEARIAVAHGQMPEAVLEQVVVDFWQRKFDVLVSTTIIETGIDIPNANTLIVDRAENFGLSQLHQIRGRVGRSRERAYAYFFYDPSKPLSETAHDRLATIASNNELGAGMQVAMKDLELRGAGNLLGAEQAGHIAGVGFDLYLRMIGEAVAEFKGEKQDSPAELKLELPVDARIPDTYLDSERLRLEAYHKLSAASGELGSREQLDAILLELEDRFGPAPEPVRTLIEVTHLRQQANRLGLKDVHLLGQLAKLQPVALTEARQVALSASLPGLKYLQTAQLLQVPIPRDEAGQPVSDRAIIDFCWSLFGTVFAEA